MEIKVIWTNFAKSELKKIFVYYAENVNSQIAKNMVTGIVTESKRLKKNPEIGQIEELLKENRQLSIFNLSEFQISLLL